MSANPLRRHAANAVTLLRIALTPIFLTCIARGPQSPSAWLAAPLFALIAASDLADGYLARRYGTDSDRGQLLDHCADIIFILPSLGLYSWLGVAPWWVPASVALSFAAYVADSWWRGGGARPTLAGNWTGHVAGVLNYALVGVLAGNETVGLQLLPPGLMAILYWLVPVYSAAAVLARARTGTPGRAPPQPPSPRD